MKFKIDENLPQEYAELLQRIGFQADTVGDEHLSGTDDAVVIAHCRSEGRILMTLDLEFGNIKAYPSGSPASAGFAVAGVIASGVLFRHHRFSIQVTRQTDTDPTPPTPCAHAENTISRTPALDRRAGSHPHPRVGPLVFSGFSAVWFWLEAGSR